MQLNNAKQTISHRIAVRSRRLRVLASELQEEADRLVQQKRFLEKFTKLWEVAQKADEKSRLLSTLVRRSSGISSEAHQEGSPSIAFRVSYASYNDIKAICDALTNLLAPEELRWEEYNPSGSNAGLSTPWLDGYIVVREEFLCELAAR